VLRLPVASNVVPSKVMLVTLIIKAIFSSETFLLTSSTQRNIPGDGILQMCVISSTAFGSDTELPVLH
jgi:hypothetical protein